jgi:hypothetical protein
LPKKKVPKEKLPNTEQKGTERSEDMLCNSLYKNYKQRVAAIPPRQPLTDIEIKQIKEQLSTTKPKYSTYGKLLSKTFGPQPGDRSIHKDDYSRQL